MRKKSGFTIVEQAIMLVPEFESVVRKLEQQVVLRGQSKSTLNNYIRRIALFVVRFGKLPEQIDPDEINEFLAALARDPRSPSRSSFKHMVYGLRYYFRLLGMNKNAIALPSLKKKAKLPVILNQQELKELFAAPTLLKQRVVLALIYSAGLRGQEVINLKIRDIDFERKTIHIRQSKYKKDRVVPLAESMAVGLRKYLKAENPHIWLFNGKEPDGRYSVRGLSWVMREDLKKTSITKDVNIGHSGLFLYPVQQLSAAFKATFLDRLKRALRKNKEMDLFNDLVQQAYKTKWVVHCEPSLASAEHVVRYLGQYTHRVAITNQRILNIADGKVTFIAKDYRDRAIKKPITLDGVEFLRRFTLHILPQRFVKIRRFGIYNHTIKRNLELQFVPSDIDTVIKQQKTPETTIERFQRLTGIDPCLCPVCKKGRMIAIRELPCIRAPAWFMFNVTHAHS